MKIALTGHTNIEKCYGYKIINGGEKYNNDCFELAYSEIYDSLKLLCKLNNLKFEDLKLILSIPHSVNWHKNRANRRTINKEEIRAQAIEYDKYLNYDKSEIFEIKKNYNNEQFMFANFARNKHMVDVCDYLISFKRYDSTGTDHCIKEGNKQNKYFGNVGEIENNLKEFEI